MYEQIFLYKTILVDITLSIYLVATSSIFFEWVNLLTFFVKI